MSKLKEIGESTNNQRIYCKNSIADEAIAQKKAEKKAKIEKYKTYDFYKKLYQTGDPSEAFKTIDIPLKLIDSNTTGGVMHIHTNTYQIEGTKIQFSQEDSGIYQSLFVEFYCKIGRKIAKYKGCIERTPKPTGYYQSPIDSRSKKFENAIIKFMDMLIEANITIK